jgi:NADP-dependent 3-hydroxy acid dehydrogenase YdfG
MKSKRVILTGASSGIGEATARLAIARGHKVLFVARSADKIHDLCKLLGESAQPFVADVRDVQAMRDMVSRAKELWGGVDVLINNAGLGYFDPLSEGRIEDWHEMIDINVKGVLNALHAALPELIECRGQVINMGSISSHYVFPNSGVYGATKHAVFAISESIRVEMPDKVRVTTISPGSVNTPFIDNTHNQKLLSDYKSYFAAGMQPDWIAEQVLYALEAPENVVVSEIITRPNRQVK